MFKSIYSNWRVWEVSFREWCEWIHSDEFYNEQNGENISKNVNKSKQSFQYIQELHSRPLQFELLKMKLIIFLLFFSYAVSMTISDSVTSDTKPISTNTPEISASYTVLKDNNVG